MHFLPKVRTLILLFSMAVSVQTLKAQQATDVTDYPITLEKALQYALTNQPAIKQAEIDESITAKAVKARLSDWLPQINFSYNYQHFIDLQ